MAYDRALAGRLRALLDDRGDLTEKAMFGGLAFLLDGRMAVAAGSDGGLMVRCAAADTDALAARPHAAPMIMRGRPMRGWLRVAPAGVATEAALAAWVAEGVRAADALADRPD
ncbi:hypothetical protein FHX74_002599 [Friedmanniella endophytica]|uniref:TfoX N-terminal domain-containing protein n=1 Tax=Microlunatus kandeliicorticis TaxID=1759536 RepID=A0A7W3P6E6_9ACTN|nr:TfoX/Sxy family protein [Microlunatus kandeliicorticis]MBA8794971.1 hypothetical protein [Microlunatus kandeliicorticis]